LNAELAGCKLNIDQLTAQYKKEATLRKKYKNELEDLKGAIRVYARVRPFAQYEIERNCEKIVAFPDETSVTVQTSRGPKEFEFDAAFTEFSTQDEVFEDTKRLVESMLDGYNVCLFAYGQTGSGES
jgi:DNA primase catalytic subunit